MRDNIWKRGKGITLIALVVTVIVLLILSATAIMSINNSMLKRAEDAKRNSQDAIEKENSVYGEYMQYLDRASGH